MNRLICTNRDRIDPSVPPAPAGGDVAGGRPVRALFINAFELGFGTTSDSLRHYAGLREDIDAVHFAIHMPNWLRAVAKETPWKARWDLHASRMFWGWRRVLRPFLAPGGPLSADRFQVVHILTQQRAAIVPWLSDRGGLQRQPAWVVNVDATLAGWDRDYQVRTHAGGPQLRQERRIYDSCSAIACASRWVAESMVNDYGVQKDKLILHMPCARGGPDSRSSAGRPEGLVRMIFVGNDFVRKGGPRLVKWHQQRWKDRAELHICSSGAPADLTGKNLFRHGPVPHERLVGELLPSMDLFVLPTWEDTFLIAAQEAQGSGVPVVSTRMCGIPEVVLDGRTGLLCPRTDDAGFIAAVERLMDNPAERARMSAAARAHARTTLNADVWHNHLLDQLVALADRRPVRPEPALTGPISAGNGPKA